MKPVWRLMAGVALAVAALGCNLPILAASALPPRALAAAKLPQSFAGKLSRVAQVSAGGAHTCAVTLDGGVKCWGNNWAGQLGDGTIRSHSAPVAVVGLMEKVMMVSAGGAHTCAVLASGGVKCWGHNQFGQLGDGTTVNRSTPVDVVGLTTAVQTSSAGAQSTCALTTQGGVQCWGKNDLGQLGDGTTINRLTPVAVVGLTGSVQSVDTGDNHACALTIDGGVQCWGYNWHGELGDGTILTRLTPVAVVDLASGIQAVSAGNEFSCALTAADRVKCWGAGSNGQLGNGHFIERQLTPLDVVDLAPGIRAVSAGAFHTCALTAGGGAACWGLNEHGQVGAGSPASNIWRPLDVVGLTSAVEGIAAGGRHTCAVLADASVKCWGWNAYGQLGDGTTIARRAPVDVWDPTYDCAAVTEIPTAECQALVTFFHATNGSMWQDHTGWLRTATPCSWQGVMCEAGHVSALVLPANNLVDALPAALGDLAALQRLDLHGNDLAGPLPAALGNLSALQYLDLSASGLAGAALPPEWGNLSALQTLDLHGNALSGPLPASLSQLDALRTLDLSHNQLRDTIPFRLADLNQLAYLDLSHNSLTGGLPFGFDPPSALQYLDLSYNQLEDGLPWVLTDVRALTHLDLSHNALFWNIPWEYGGLTALTYLDLHANRFSGVIQPDLGNLHALTYLDLSANHLTYNIPPELGGIGSVITATAAITINLAGNHLLDGIPATLGGIAGLRSLDLSGNQLSGVVPAAVAEHPFATLNLNYNRLEPTDPRWRDTQTVAPTNLRGVADGETVRLTWTPIPYAGAGPYEVWYVTYEISYATDPSGPFTVAGRTAENGAASYTVTGLAPMTTYYFRVRTFTPAHPYWGLNGEIVYQPNNLWSDYTPLVSVHVPATPTPTTTPTATPTASQTPSPARLGMFLPLVWR